MPIRQLPPVPTRDDPVNFALKGDAFLAALPGFVDDANALEQSMQLQATVGTSTSSLTVGTGAKTLTASTGKAWVVGAWVYVFSALAVSNYMVGRVTAYNATTGALTVNVSAIDGSGTYSSWIIGLATPQIDTHLLPRDGSRAMTGALVLAGDAAQPLHPASLQQVQTLMAAATPVGSIKAMARMTAPAGWLLVDGKTIGNAASGATSRANDDTLALFTELWNFPAASVPIYDSTGAASTRGASAAADFAANKRIALFTPDGGAFLRMWAPGQTRDAGRVAGSVQEDAFESHTHGGVPLAVPDTDRGTGNVSSFSIDQFGQTTAAGDTETRPYNLAVPHYIKL